MPSAVVSPAMTIMRRTRFASNAACSGFISCAAVSLMNAVELQSVVVIGDEGSPRLDRVLAKRLPQLSRSRLKALILDGQITIASRSIRDPAYHVTAGETITISVPPPAEPKPQ